MALPGFYGKLDHEYQVNWDMLAQFKPKAIVVLDPTAAKVAKIWAIVKGWNPYIILRKWEWDDGRLSEGDPGTYAELWADPIGYGRKFVRQWIDFLRLEFYIDEDWNNPKLPPPDQVICHLQNEPDTNGVNKQVAIDQFTVSAIKTANAFYRSDSSHTFPVNLGCYNFGEGHPADLKNGKPNWKPFAQSLALLNNSTHWVLLHEYASSLGVTDPSNNPWHVFRHTMAPLSSKWNVGIAEWGIEELVNRVMDHHQGWQGRLSAMQFAADYLYYCQHCAGWVQWVCIFASDTPGWNTFDPAPAKDELVKVSRKLWADQGSGGEIDSGPTIPGTPPPTQALIPPCVGTVTQRWGENYASYMSKFGIPGHNGIDFGNDEGTPIVSVADGTVAFTGWDGDYGNYIRVWYPQYHLHGFFAHLSRIDVQGSVAVKQGQQIGLMGNTGNSTGPHLHYELRFGDEFSYWDVSAVHGKGRCNPEVVYSLLNGKDEL